MRLVSVSCNLCGAPLEAPAKARYLTCGYCSSRLEVHRSPSAVYTEVLEQVEERTQQIAKDVEALQLRNQVEQLDRDWTMSKQRYTVGNNYGELYVPTVAESIFRAVVLTAIGVTLLVLPSQLAGPRQLPSFGRVSVVVFAMALFIGIRGILRARAYDEHRESYMRLRMELLKKLNTKP